MVFLIRIITFTLFFLSFQLRAFEVDFSCFPESKCLEFSQKIKGVDNRFDAIDLAKSFGLDKSVKYLSVYNEKDVVRVELEIKPTIVDVSYSAPADIEVDQVAKISQIQEDVLFNDYELLQAKERVESWLFERGFLYPSFEYQVRYDEENNVLIDINIGFKQKLKLKIIEVEGRENSLLTELLRPIYKLKRLPYSRISFKLAIDNLINELKTNGYLKSKITFKDNIAPPNVKVSLAIELGERYQFSFYGNELVSREELTNSLTKSILDGSVNTEKLKLESFLEANYEKRGLYHTKVRVYQKVGKNIDGDSIRTFYFNIKEGKKIPVRKISFKGNLLVDIEELEDLYYSNGSVISQRDYLDKKYIESFVSVLKDYYLRRGFVFIDVAKPQIFLPEDKSYAEVSFSVKERQQSVLEKINLKGVSEKFKTQILTSLRNKEGSPLNVIELEKDISRGLNSLREAGFYFATITNINDDDVVTYESNYTKSQLNLNFDSGKLTRLENIVLSGNKVTKDKVLKREVPLRRGDLITPAIIKQVRDNINALGLFASVDVLPIVTNKLSDDDENLVNLVIQVVEKKFGRGEIAPGYRTDIGAKLSFTLSRTNLLGHADSGTLKLQLNRRFSLSQFDSRRAGQKNQKIEGIATLNYKFPHLLDAANFDGSFSVQRRRFFAFDADIFRFSPQLSRQFTHRIGNDFKYQIGLSLKYQYERIRQFDATEEKDRATFEIGSLTPGITLDMRDSNVSPRSGAYFGLNWEFANPGFGSQNNEEIEINFSKLISRNRFYLPLNSNKSFVLAFSVAGGIQENYADEEAGFNSDGSIRTRGYIPSIKVFRLDGFDVVRGYADNEINKLEDGADIIEKRVQSKAYFMNFKFEPRYYIDDTLVVGPFFDAGRLFIDTFRPSDLRTSAGLTFKFLTPVGTLDFDYGVKLNRRDLGGGNKESFGRFHLSIGYF